MSYGGFWLVSYIDLGILWYQKNKMNARNYVVGYQSTDSVSFELVVLSSVKFGNGALS